MHRGGRVSARPRVRAGQRRCRDLRRLLLRLRFSGRTARTRAGTRGVSRGTKPRATDTAPSSAVAGCDTSSSSSSSSWCSSSSGTVLPSGELDPAIQSPAASREPRSSSSTPDAAPGSEVPPREARLRGRPFVPPGRLAHRTIHLLRRPSLVEGQVRSAPVRGPTRQRVRLVH